MEKQSVQPGSSEHRHYTKLSEFLQGKKSEDKSLFGDMSVKMGISRPQLHFIVTGKRNAGPKAIKAISRYFNLPYEEVERLSKIYIPYPEEFEEQNKPINLIPNIEEHLEDDKLIEIKEKRVKLSNILDSQNPSFQLFLLSRVIEVMETEISKNFPDIHFKVLKQDILELQNQWLTEVKTMGEEMPTMKKKGEGYLEHYDDKYSLKFYLQPELIEVTVSETNKHLLGLFQDFLKEETLNYLSFEQEESVFLKNTRTITSVWFSPMAPYVTIQKYIKYININSQDLTILEPRIDRYIRSFV